MFLPIAEMSVHGGVILAMGFGVGFLSGMFGIGGGFLLTPLLMFYGIPPAVAVATGTSQLTAVTMSGVLTNWKRRTVDFRLGWALVAGGAVGALGGAGLFGWLQHLGQIETVITLSYVVMLGTVGALMLIETLRTLRCKTDDPVETRGPGQHRWIHRLPLKVRFAEARLYISVIPPVLLGVFVGLLSAVLGVGGGFLLVPVMIYLLRVPTAIAIGTSLFQILFVSALTTVFQAAGNYSVDIMLALILIIGGVVGVQYGVRVGARLRAVELRLLLALLVLAVAAKLLADIIVTPADLYSVTGAS